ncbi:hypothetical protein FNF31_06255 [Cafeteria roenbergensis]|uniref:EF-hand domain-containing protein n=1 Tax=Cafeteria roenbergensis TaxID=33653 RepID=A0A5A8CR41_CAFRO|nr:hypothetical protein FNF31_06255 [Cafeteria roenbergensis]
MVAQAFLELDTRHDGELDRRELYRSLRSSKTALKLFGLPDTLRTLTQDALRGLVEGIIYDVAHVSQGRGAAEGPVRGVTWAEFLAFFCERRGVVYSFSAPVDGDIAADNSRATVRLTLRPHHAELLDVDGRSPADVATGAPEDCLLRSPSAPLRSLHGSYFGGRVFRALAAAAPGSPAAKAAKASREGSAMLNSLVAPCCGGPAERSGLFHEALVVVFAFEASGQAEMSVQPGDMLVQGPNPRLGAASDEAAVPPGWVHVFRIPSPECTSVDHGYVPRSYAVDSEPPSPTPAASPRLLAALRRAREGASRRGSASSAEDSDGPRSPLPGLGSAFAIRRPSASIATDPEAGGTASPRSPRSPVGSPVAVSAADELFKRVSEALSAAQSSAAQGQAASPTRSSLAAAPASAEELAASARRQRTQQADAAAAGNAAPASAPKAGASVPRTLVMRHSFTAQGDGEMSVERGTRLKVAPEQVALDDGWVLVSVEAEQPQAAIGTLPPALSGGVTSAVPGIERAPPGPRIGTKS